MDNHPNGATEIQTPQENSLKHFAIQQTSLGCKTVEHHQPIFTGCTKLLIGQTLLCSQQIYFQKLKQRSKMAVEQVTISQLWSI